MNLYSDVFSVFFLSSLYADKDPWIGWTWFCVEKFINSDFQASQSNFTIELKSNVFLNSCGVESKQTEGLFETLSREFAMKHSSVHSFVFISFASFSFLAVMMLFVMNDILHISEVFIKCCILRFCTRSHQGNLLLHNDRHFNFQPKASAITISSNDDFIFNSTLSFSNWTSVVNLLMKITIIERLIKLVLCNSECEARKWKEFCDKPLSIQSISLAIGEALLIKYLKPNSVNSKRQYCFCNSILSSLNVSCWLNDIDISTWRQISG